MDVKNVIKALEWLIVNFPKQDNPEDDSDRLCNCINLYCQNAVDLIKRQQAESEELTERLQEYKSFPCFTNDTQVVTVSKKADGQYCADRVTTIQIDKIRAEAYKEFAEGLKDRISDSIEQSMYNPDGENYFITDVYDTIEDVKKELTEGK